MHCYTASRTALFLQQEPCLNVLTLTFLEGSKNLYLFFTIFQAYVIKAKGDRTDPKISIQQLSNKDIHPSCWWVHTNVCSESAETIDLTVSVSKNYIFDFSHLSYFNLSLLSTLLALVLFSDEWPCQWPDKFSPGRSRPIETPSSLVLACYSGLHKQLS